MIILEGADGAGKSTLGSMLLKHAVIDKLMDSPRLACGGKKELLYHETSRYINNDGYNKRVAVDRLLFSEMVYGPVLRGTTVFTSRQYLDLLSQVIASRSLIIFCMPNQHNFKSDESEFVIERLPLLREKYQTYFLSVKEIYANILQYNWQDPHGFEKLVTKINEWRAM